MACLSTPRLSAGPDTSATEGRVAWAPGRSLWVGGMNDRVLHWLERTWMAQQLPWAALFLGVGGLPWLVRGIPVRIAVSLTGHWLVGHLTHRRVPQGWAVDGVAVQGRDFPAAALITFGEAWHGNHHAWTESARLGVEPGQPDPGWWLLVALRRLGLVWDLREPGDLEPRAGCVGWAPRMREGLPVSSG